MQFLKIFLTILASAAVIGAFYVMTLFSPAPYVEDEFDQLMDPNADSASLLKQSEQLERDFEAASSASVTPTAENLDKLRKAVRLQELYITRSRTFDRSPTDRLMRLQTKLQNLEAQPRYQKMLEFENEAKIKSGEGKVREAEELYRKAYDIQMQINGDYPFSNFKNIGKSADLSRQIKLLQARPLYEETLKFEAQARKAFAEKRWEDSRKFFEKAYDAILKMNTQFPNSGYSDFLRLQKIESEIDSLKSVELYKKISEVELKAKKYEAENSTVLAAEAYADAQNLQRELNRVYPKSVHASDAKVTEFEKKKIDFSSKKLADEIISQNKIMTQALRDRQATDAVRLTDSLLRKTESFIEHYPNNEIINTDFLMRLRYLNYIASEIDKIQKQTLPNFIKIDPSSKILMYKTEIPQSIYYTIMQENPSRDSKDLHKPVDSVNYEDIQRFCNRLGWILARDIELPTLEQYKQAVGSLKYVKLNDISWTSLNSNNTTKAVSMKKANDKGFFDLLGNVSEYVLPSENSADDEILLVGGNVQTSSDAVLDLDIRKTDKKSRNRMGGFRVIIKPDEQKDGVKSAK